MRRAGIWAAAALTAAAVAFAISGYYAPRRGPSVGGPFELTTHDGRKLAARDLLGQPFAVFFGFTLCPDVCPTTLSDLTNVMKDSGPAASRMKFLFITIDPERDTADQLKLYLSSFDDRIIGLTGTPAEVAAAAKAYRAFYTKVPTSDGYTMNHSTMMYLMDRRGEFAGLINYQEQHVSQIAKLRKLVGG
jgi:protein SCO1/2